MITNISHQHVKQEMKTWAKNLLEGGDFLILDCETTGLDERAEIVQIAVINAAEGVLLDTLVKPTKPMDENSRAFQISGITNEMLMNAPDFAMLWPALSEFLVGERVIAYNADYDRRLIQQTLDLHGIMQGAGCQFIDLMVPYSNFVGEWNAKYKNYKWQKLPGTAHSALEDCKAALAVLRKMASDG